MSLLLPLGIYAGVKVVAVAAGTATVMRTKKVKTVCKFSEARSVLK